MHACFLQYFFAAFGKMFARFSWFLQTCTLLLLVMYIYTYISSAFAEDRGSEYRGQVRALQERIRELEREQVEYLTTTSNAHTSVHHTLSSGRGDECICLIIVVKNLLRKINNRGFKNIFSTWTCVRCTHISGKEICKGLLSVHSKVFSFSVLHCAVVILSLFAEVSEQIEQEVREGSGAYTHIQTQHQQLKDKLLNEVMNALACCTKSSPVNIVIKPQALRSNWGI